MNGYGHLEFFRRACEKKFLGTEEFLETMQALERNVPEEVGWGYDEDGVCPRCDTALPEYSDGRCMHRARFCPCCGQCIDWGEENEE